MITTRTHDGVAAPVVDEILRRIRSGELRRGDHLGSEVELAERYAISRMTVRRALDDLVDDGLIERRRGQGIFVRQPFLASRVIQIVVPSLSHDESVHTIRGVQNAARDSGLDVQIFDANNDFERAIDLVKRLPNGTGRAAVIRFIHDPRFVAALYELKRRHFPFVTVDYRMTELDIPSVTSDEYGAGYLAGEELLKLGHKRVGAVTLRDAQTSGKRVAGFRDAFNDAGYPVRRDWIQQFNVDDPLGDWSTPIDHATAAVMSGADRPTALLHGNDRGAVLGYRSLQKLGLRIPEDVSVVGNGDAEVASLVSPTLATLRQPWEAQGVEAYRLLCRLDECKVSAGKRHVVLPVTWLPRESVGPAPDADVCNPSCRRQTGRVLVAPHSEEDHDYAS